MSIKGMLFGGIADIVATNVLLVPLGVFIMVSTNVMQLPRAQQQPALMNAIHANPVLFATQLGIGLAGSVLGGYVAAWLSRRDKLLNGALSSWLCLLSAIYGIAFGSSHDSALTQIAYILVSPAAGLLGGYLRIKQTGRESSD